MNKVKTALIGCGNIAPQYIRGGRAFDILDITACADLDPAAAARLAQEHNLQAMTVPELLADDSIELVINLTIPAAHVEVSLAILAAGKHLYSEKPLATNRPDGRRILDAARAAGLRAGCAPDTFLGGGLQTARKLIDDGWIGQPVAAVAFLLGRGLESWHPNPYFFFQPGAGPMFDMGPYYLTALIHLLGPIRRTAGATRAAFSERIVTSRPHYGQRIPVNTPTHVAGLLDFVSGPIASLITSFDVWSHNLPRIEIYGSEGSLSVPDPNIFSGPVRLRAAGAADWSDMPLTHSDQVSRGIGVADLAHALRTGRPHRASGELAYHVLDVMQSFEESSDTGRHVTIASTCTRPAALPMGLAADRLDD
jgi:predicted dehydrogenase